MSVSLIPWSVCLPYLKRHAGEVKAPSPVQLSPRAETDEAKDGTTSKTTTEETSTITPAVKTTLELLEDSDVEESVREKLISFVKSSDAFHRKNDFPIDANRCHRVLKRGDATPSEMASSIDGAYPIFHEDVLPLLCAFIDFKRVFGSPRERDFYKDMGILEFVNRLIVKRPLKFVGDMDSYVLRDSRRTGFLGWENIGTAQEEKPLVMEDYMTYDEIKMSAFLCASAPTFPINSGKRHSAGVPFFESAPFERRGVYVGIAGPRMVKEFVMESQEVLTTPEQNTSDQGFGLVPNPEAVASSPTDFVKLVKDPLTPFLKTLKIDTKTTPAHLMALFYGLPRSFPTYGEMSAASASASRSAPTAAVMKLIGRAGDNQLSERIKKGTIVKLATKWMDKLSFFDCDVYKRRTRISAETFLIEANHRGKVEGKRVYVHVVGFGLGVWRVASVQDKLFLDAFAEAIQTLRLEHVSDLDFSWIAAKKCGDVGDGETFPGTDIVLHFSMRDPFAKLEGTHEGKLVVASWAWDANSFPGNEYWSRSLTSSSDPAATCCSQIQETLNPFVNPNYSASNLRVATRDRGLVSFQEFVSEFLHRADAIDNK